MKFKGVEWLGAALILLSCGVQLAEGQQMSKLMGGHITWRLENDFETSRNVTWTVHSSWHTSDITYSSVGGGTGVSLVLGRPVVYPPGNDLNDEYGSTFGTLRIKTENGTFAYPNKWIVEYIDGQNVGGSFSVTMQLPERSYVNNASLTLGLGGPMLRSQGEVGDGGTQAIVANGGLPACLFPGATPIPCELYIDGRANSNPLDLFTSLNLPRPEQTELWYTGPHTNFTRIRNRNSPMPVYRPIMQITEPPAPAPAPRFGWRAYDLDGLPYTRHYPAQSTRDGSGNTNVECANGNLLTTDGCNGLINGGPSLLDQPPFVGYDYRFLTEGKVVSDDNEFYMSLTWKTTDGTNVVTSEFLVNFCKPVIEVGVTEVLDRAPEWVTLDPDGNIRRFLDGGYSQEAYPNTTVNCYLEGPCKFYVHAAKFTASTGTTAAADDVPLISVDGPMVGGNVTDRRTLANNVYQVEYTVGDGPLGTHVASDIGKYKSICFYAKAKSRCRSMPLCFNIKILGNDPFFIPPTPPMVNPGDDVRIDEITEQAVCAGFTVSFTIKAEDADEGEHVVITTEDATGDGQDIFGPPYNAAKIGQFRGEANPGFLDVSYTLDLSNGVAVDPVSRRTTFAQDRAICSRVSDNAFEAHYRFGLLPYGNFRSQTKCHKIYFSGPPTFITDANRQDGTPFGELFGTLEERMRTIDAFIGVERKITFRAQDPNIRDSTSIFFLEDPGIPNGADTGTSVCEPQYVPVNWDPDGIWTNCSVASRTVTWTPQNTTDYSRNLRICAISRDNVPQTICPTPQMSDEGWYGETQCVEIRVIPSQIVWGNDSKVREGQNMTVLNAYVPCSMEYLVTASDLARGVNASAVEVDAPYSVVIENATELPSRVTLRSDVYGRQSRSTIVYRAGRGDEGRQDIVCIHARDDMHVTTTGAYCVVLQIKRCAYCVETADTLQLIMRETIGDFNWLRMWVANGNDDEDPDTQLIENPDFVQASGQYEKQIVNVGSLYTVNLGESLSELAGRFQTTVKKLVQLNPDVSSGADGVLGVGQEMCIIPCSDLPFIYDTVPPFDSDAVVA